MHPISRILLIPLTALLYSNQTNAEVYKWIDKNGKVHYSDKPVDEKSKKLKIKERISKNEQQKAKARADRLIKPR